MRALQSGPGGERPAANIAPTFQQPFIIPYLFSLNAVNLSGSLFGLIGSIGRESLREYKWHHLLLFFLVRRRLRKIMALFLGALISYSSLLFLFFSAPALIWLARQNSLAVRGARARWGRAGKQIIFGGINCCVTISASGRKRKRAERGFYQNGTRDKKIYDLGEKFFGVCQTAESSSNFWCTHIEGERQILQ